MVCAVHDWAWLGLLADTLVVECVKCVEGEWAHVVVVVESVD